MKYKQKYLNLKKLIGGADPHGCTPEELMTNLNYETECKNNTAVIGSCGVPSFDNDLTFQLEDDTFINLQKIFNFCNENEQISNIHIVLGATKKFNSDFFTNENSIILYFDPFNATYTDIIDNLYNYPNSMSFKFRLPFPLNHLDEKSKIILNIIIEINKIKPIFITNRMCGTCHRSLYYLVQNNVKYTVNPEQGLGIMDTEEIKNCFFKYQYITIGKKIIRTEYKFNDNGEKMKNDDGEYIYEGDSEIWYQKKI